MSDYTQTLTINKAPEAVFEFISKVENLPRYLPTARRVTHEQGDKIRVKGEVRGHNYEDTGFFKVDQTHMLLRWGSDGEDDYSGLLQVVPAGSGACQVQVSITMNPSEDKARQMKQSGMSPEQILKEGVDKTLLSIKNLLEGHGGKVDASSPSPSLSGDSPINYNTDA